MRKEAKQNTTNRDLQNTANIANVQGYHAGGGWDGESYAFTGFHSGLRLFTSDRFIKLVMNGESSARPDGKPLQGYGLEIETECDGITNQTVLAEVYDKVIFSHFPEGLFKMQRDGSLRGRTSAECITQIMTKAFIRNQYKTFKLMYNTYFPAFDISASRTGNCGMHVNISTGCFGAKPENIESNCKKLLYFVNKNYNLCCALFARNTAHTGYCARMYDYTEKTACKNANIHNMPSSHGICMNYSHFDAGRIEIRLVGGQKDFGCFRNTMECIFHLVEAVKRVSWEKIDSLTDVFKGCNQYVFDRLESKCSEYITSADLDAIRENVKPMDLI